MVSVYSYDDPTADFIVEIICYVVIDLLLKTLIPVGVERVEFLQ